MRLNEQKVELLTGLKSTARTSTQRGTRKRAKLLDFPFILVELEPELNLSGTLRQEPHRRKWNSKKKFLARERHMPLVVHPVFTPTKISIIILRCIKSVIFTFISFFFIPESVGVLKEAIPSNQVPILLSSITPKPPAFLEV